MKILVATPYYYPKHGGLETYARQLGLALRDLEDCEIVVVTSNHDGHKMVRELVDNMPVYRLQIWAKLSNTPINLLWPFQIRRIIKQEKPDVILAHTPVPSMADATALATGRTPLVLFYHASTLLKGDSKLFNILARAYGLYQRVTFKRAYRIFAVSDYVKQELGLALAHKTSVVPNAVWRSQVISRAQPSKTNFLFVGSLDQTHSWKGLDLTIESLALYKQLYSEDFTLSVMGEGNYRTTYEAQVRKLGLENHVIFLGPKAGEEKDAEFLKATALVMYPTTANDAFPTVMLEAWARSVPVIAAAIGPIPTLINDGLDGYLVEAKNVDALAATLDKVARSTKQQRSTITKTAMARTLEAYTWERQASVVAARLRELL
ncbi:MAG TPA: glycosyltransferase family 4 protein [Patescibacteria group bacterium]|nr:glycosyltransferase family 4 protein [Patescibacteria group bacterium]